MLLCLFNPGEASCNIVDKCCFLWVMVLRILASYRHQEDESNDNGRHEVFTNKIEVKRFNDTALSQLITMDVVTIVFCLEKTVKSTWQFLCIIQCAPSFDQLKLEFEFLNIWENKIRATKRHWFSSSNRMAPLCICSSQKRPSDTFTT